MIGISYGFCHCGCNRRTNIAPRTRGKLSWVKGEPIPYILGHGIKGKRLKTIPSGEKHPRWKGGRICRKSHDMVKATNHPKSSTQGYVFEHILFAERALGKYLPDKAKVHHHTQTDLVICQDQAYHMLLHKRMRALKSCGNANWLKCRYCKIYDDPKNLSIAGRNIYHKKCNTLHRREYYLHSLGVKK